MSNPTFTKFNTAVPNPQIANVEDVAPEELRAKKDQVVIVDVRRSDEWVGEFGHIPEAHHIVLDTLPMRFNELPTDRTLVIVCRSGGRSAQATAFLLENGFESVYNMRGGMIEWTQNNFETTERNG